MQHLKRSLIASFIITLFIAAPVWAQETGSITGTASDPDGAPLPGVAVTVEGNLVPTSTIYTQANGVYRFPVLPPGDDYQLTFQLEGFKTVVQQLLLVRVGGNTQINVGMELSTVEETVTVTGSTPIVDVKNTGTGTNVTEEYMQSIPSGRDPWVMMEQARGLQVDRQNIGGSEGGQQSSFSANGSRRSDAVWTYDGAEITDMAALGASPMYYDFDAFEEISLTTGGNDPSIQSGGIRINFVTKRGGNSWRGSGRFYWTDGDWQSQTVGDSEGNLVGNFTAEELYPRYIGNRINDIKDFGGELGGPLARNKFFVWAAYGKQDIKQQVGISEDNTQLRNYHAKANWHVSDNLVLNYTFVFGDKTKQGRGASASRPPATTFNQEGPTPINTGKVQWTINDNNYLEATYNDTGLGFSLTPAVCCTTQPRYDLATGQWGASYYFYDTTRPLKNAKLDGNSYLAGSSVDHELKYGFSSRSADTFSEWGPSGGAVAISIAGAAAEAWLIQTDFDNYGGDRYSFYAGDTISAGRATINVGLRYDNQKSRSYASEVGAHPFAPGTFPANSFPGFEPDFAWNSISPRVGLTYDLSGNSSTILRFNAARYYAQQYSGEFHRKNTTAGREIDYEWFDLNGNGDIDVGETGDILWTSGGWDPANPLAPSSNVVNATNAPWSDELLLGMEHEITRTFGVGGNFIYRKNSNNTWNIRSGENDSSFWEAVQQSTSAGNITVFQPTGARSRFNEYQQRAGYNTTYTGIELYMTKRFADRWMSSASFTWSSPKQNYDTGGFTDPTNIAVLDGNIESAGSRTEAYWGASRWYLKTSGMYQFGGGFNIAGYFQVREGNIIAPYVRSNNRANSSGRVNAIQDAFGSHRLATYWNLDLRAEKTFDMGDRGRVHFIVDAFNLTSNDIVLAQQTQINSSVFERISEVQQGRTIRFGLRLILR